MTSPADWHIRASLAATPVSRTWQVARGAERAVLRRDEALALRLGLNRAAEPQVLDAAHAAGLGPVCLAADPAGGWQLTAWLPGRAWTASDLKEPANLVRAAALLRRLHATPLEGPVVDLGAAIDRYAGLAGSGSARLAAMAREGLARATDPPAAPLCFCHNDPTPGNFLDSAGGELHLIDWEYAGLCHPGFDLAGLALGASLGAGLPPGLEKVLLGAYLGRPPTGSETARHRTWEEVGRCLGTLWQGALAGTDCEESALV